MSADFVKDFGKKVEGFGTVFTDHVLKGDTYAENVVFWRPQKGAPEGTGRKTGQNFPLLSPISAEGGGRVRLFCKKYLLRRIRGAVCRFFCGWRSARCIIHNIERISIKNFQKAMQRSVRNAEDMRRIYCFVRGRPQVRPHTRARGAGARRAEKGTENMKIGQKCGKCPADLSAKIIKICYNREKEGHDARGTQKAHVGAP